MLAMFPDPDDMRVEHPAEIVSEQRAVDVKPQIEIAQSGQTLSITLRGMIKRG
jgi:hypothetical protein